MCMQVADFVANGRFVLQLLHGVTTLARGVGQFRRIEAF